MHPKWNMRAAQIFAFAVSLSVLGACPAFPQRASQSRPDGDTTGGNAHRRAVSLSDDDRLSLIAAALDAKVTGVEADCSHLVHAIYEQAGFTYAYAPSSDLYAGVEGFERVKKPEPGDLVAWRGHVGIVIKPSKHIFFSFLSSGPGIDDYTTRYWKHRGKPRFYRYVKSTFDSHKPQLVRTNRVHAAADSDPDAENDR